MITTVFGGVPLPTNSIEFAQEQRYARRMTVQPEEEVAFQRSLDAVNREFYRQAPSDYFKRRLYSMAMMAGRPDLVRCALAEGLSVGAATFHHAHWPVDDEYQNAYLAVESEVILYHASEALLRLLIAHYPRDGSLPALNLAAVTSHQEFYGKVRSHFVDSTDEQLDHLIERTIHGFRSPEGMPTVDDPEFTPQAAVMGKANLRPLLRYLARLLLEDDYRFINNAAKHGLAVRAAEHGFRLGGRTPDARPIVDQRGEAVSCITVVKDRTSGETVVDQVVIWSNPIRNLALVDYLLEVMESLWSVARNRFLGEEGVIVRLFHSYGLEEIFNVSRGSGAGTGDGLRFLEIPHVRLPLGIVLA